jgi:hypothetical protein
MAIRADHRLDRTGSRFRSAPIIVLIGRDRAGDPADHHPDRTRSCLRSAPIIVLIGRDRASDPRRSWS